jgi:hypothetical protein
VRFPRLPEGYSLRKPAVLALVVALLGCSAIFGLTADNMRSAPTATTKDPDITEFDPVLASFNFRKTAQSSLAMAVSFLRQAQSGAYDIAAVAPRIQQQAAAATEAAAGAKRAVSTANDALSAAKRQAEAANSPGGAAQTTEEAEGIRSLEAGVKAAQNYAADADKFKQGTDKLLAAVKQAQQQEALAKGQQQPGQTKPGETTQPGQPTQPGRPTGPVLASPPVGGGGGGVAQPPSWLGNGQRPGQTEPGGAGGFEPERPAPTTTTAPKPLSPCAILPELTKLAKGAPAESPAVLPVAQPAAAGGATTTTTTTTEAPAAPPAQGEGGLSPVQAAALVKVCKAKAAYTERARDPNAATPSARVQALNAADAAANADRDVFAAELAAEQRTDPSKPIAGYFITEEFIQPAADAQADYELKAATAAQLAGASQAADAAKAANPNDPNLVADAAAKKTAANKAKADADAAKKVAEDIKKIADEVQAYPGHLTSVQTRSRSALPADTKVPGVTKAEAAWVVLLADLQVKRGAAAKARAGAHAALLDAEKSIADLNGIPADTAPAARDALAQATGDKIVAALMAWRAAIAATDAEADAEDMALLAQQLWAKADAKRRGVPAPDFPAKPGLAQQANAQGQPAQQPQPSAASSDPVDLQPAQQGFAKADKPAG